MDSPTLIGCVDGGGDRATGLILDCLWRLFGHEEVEAGLADLEDGTPAALRRWALELARAEELQSIWRHAAERKEPPKSSRDLWAVASAVVAHMRQVSGLRTQMIGLHDAEHRRAWRTMEHEGQIQRHTRLEHFFAGLRESPRKTPPQGAAANKRLSQSSQSGHRDSVQRGSLQGTSVQRTSLTTTASPFTSQMSPSSPSFASSWKDRPSRSRCSAMTAADHEEWSQQMSSMTVPEMPMMTQTATLRRRSSGRIVLPPVVPAYEADDDSSTPKDSLVVAVPPGSFNYFAVFPHLAKKPPPPARRLFFKELPETRSSSKSSKWQMEEMLVHIRKERTESVVSPSDLREAARLLNGDGDPAPSRRQSVASRRNSASYTQSLTMSAPQLAMATTVGAMPQEEDNRGLVKQLMTFRKDDLHSTLYKKRVADGRDPCPDRIFDRNVRRELARTWQAPFTTPAAGQPPPRNLRTTSHGLPPLFQKGSYWNPEREQDVECNPGAAQYLRTCLDEGVLPDLLPFLTGHSAKLEAASRELTDKDLGAITAMLGRVATAKVIDLSNNPLLTDKSMAPFLDALLRQQLPATVARLSLANCHALSLKTATKLASLVESDQAARLRTLDLTGVRLSLAAQVHISGTIREHDELRELKLANTNISGRDCLHVLLANDRLQLIDLSWNSFDEHCFATIGELLVKNVSLHTLACSNSSTPSGKRLTPIVRLLEALSGISNLQQLDLAADQIDYRAALVLEDVLGDHPKLRRLVLAQNPLGILGCRSMLRLLCSQASCLRSVDFAGCFADAQGRLEQTGPGFRPNSPGGTYQLDFTQPYHRSIMRMLAKTAERLNLQIADALTPLAGATTLPEKTPAGLWTVPTAGGTRIKFNVEKAMGRSLGDRWDFHGLLAEQSQLLRCRLPAAKQLQLFKQFSTLRMQIQDQVVFLNALAKDFLLEPSQILQLGFEREIAEEVVWRLLPCTAGAKERYLTILAAPTFRGYISALQHSHSLLNLNVQNPSGHYRLDLANPSDAFVGQQLLHLDRWEGVLRQELRRKDTSRMFGSCIFNALYLEKRIDSGPMNDWPWPEHGLLALDYASGKRPTAEDSAVATPSFRNLCQALHLCSLTEEQKVAALVPVSHELFLSSLQLRTLLLLLETPNARLQLFELLYLRIVDIQNQTLARDVLDESCNFCKLERFNQCMMFPFVQPESFAFEFNLKHLDHRLASLAVFKLCEVEGWANLPEPAFVADEADEDGTDEALFWRSSKEVSLDSMPTRGLFRGKYMGSPSTRSLKCRKQLLEMWGYWQVALSEDRICWAAKPFQEPEEVTPLVEWLIMRYPDLTKAFQHICKSVPDGLQTAGALRAAEMEEGLKALGFGRLESSGIAGVFRYLASKDVLAQADWKKLESSWSQARLSAKDFVIFMQSMVGETLEEWWSSLGQEVTGKVSRVQWNDACRMRGFYGNSTQVYRLLEEDDAETITWTEFQALRKFAA